MTGSDFDTFLAVFTAASTADLATTLVVTNDDVWLGTISSFVAFSAVSNVEYRIMIDGFSGDSGNVVLTWFPTPANDDFANAQPITTETGVLRGSNVGATVETNEPTYNGVLAGASVWYRWTAPRSGLAMVDTAESNFDTLLAIFTGTSLSGVTLVAANDNNSPDGTSVVWFMATQGESYSISVNARLPEGVADRFRLHWGFVPEGVPANDAFSQAQLLVGAEGRVSGFNYNATRQQGEPSHGSNTTGQSLWYHWTPPTNGTVVLDLAGSTLNCRLAAYTGNSVDGLTQITNTDVTGLGPIIMPVNTNTVYHLAVDGYLNVTFSFPPWLSPTGRVSLHWVMVPPVPINDRFSDAVVITGRSGAVSGSNSGGSIETGEPDKAANPGGASVWYRWVAPATGRYTFDMSGTGFDTLLAIYTGSAVNQLTLCGANDDQQNPLRTSCVSFNANSGTEYFIAVDGYLPDGNAVKLGRFVLNWAPRYQEPELAPVSPRLVIEPFAAGLGQIISWPANNGGFGLQTTTNLAGSTLWTDLSNVTTTAESMFYTNTIGNTESRFFRLFKAQ